VSRKRWIWLGLLVVAVILIGAAAWGSRDQLAYAHIATGYAAKQTCSCLHVSGRTLESCMAEFPAEDRDNFAVRAEGDRVRASVLFGVISAEAAFEDGFGCRILN
jgi:hypothetical protein